ncbi:hypothetical protein GCM10008955_04720 [Deinococcus malanensis]|uniref:DUF3108 domain-containing protein n=2 Tax=Deinococcus malanensis TaxID=1706855 RepID=A0ABQ2EK46_9DEIO|nr:hypothetical protein GCM10008955_04720 [Deinococcus malanensis]
MQGELRFTLSTMSERLLLVRLSLLVALLGLGACAPTRSAAPSTVQASTPVSGVSFYPREAGLAWSYLPEGDPATAIPYTLRAMGPSVFAGQTVQTFELTGRGAQQTWFRTFTDSGVFLQGIRKPGLTIRLEPPMQEYPAPGSWRVGLAWQGQSQVTVVDDAGKTQAQGSVTYSYLVQQQRRVQTPGGTFNVWVVTRQMSDTVGGLFPATQQLWFTPFTGEVRSPEGLLLTGRNFSTPRSGSQP